MSNASLEGDAQLASASPTILVVDDYAPNLAAFESALEPLGEPIETALSGLHALSRLEEHDFAVALVDVHIPDLSGLDVAKRLRERAIHTPIIFLTAKNEDHGLRAKGYAIGAVDFLIKPIEPEVLRAKVLTFVELHRQRRKLSTLSASHDRERVNARQQLRTLAAVSSNLSHCVTAEHALDTFLSEAHSAVGATNSFAYMRAHTGARELELVGVRGVPPEALAQFQTVSLEQPLPLTLAVARAAPVWLGSRVALEREFPQLAQAAENEAVAVLPIAVSGAAVGAVAFSFKEPKSWTADEREFFVTLVALLVTALERARLTHAERQINAQLAQRGEALRLIADVGTLLSSSLDYELVLRQLTQMLVPVIADWSAIDVLDAAGRVQRLAAYHSDPEKIAQAHAIEQRYPADPDAPHGVPNVLRTGQTEWMSEIPDALLRAAAKSEEHLHLIISLGLRSYVAVPLKAHGKILGALSLVYAESGRRYTAEDVRYVEELAQRAALSIDNAKLFMQQVSARQTLERQARQALLIGDVGNALTRSETLREALQRCADAIVIHMDAAFAGIWTVEPQTPTLSLQASADGYTRSAASQPRLPIDDAELERIVKGATPHFASSTQDDAWVRSQDWANTNEGTLSFAGYPLIVNGKVVAVMALLARSELTPDAMSGLSSIADAIAIGIDRARADNRARLERDTLEIVNEVGQALAAELDQDKLVQAVTDYATRLADAAFGAFFYNVVGESGESYMLYAISGVPREAFSRFPMPRNTQVFAPTFSGAGTVRVDDIRKDSRYGHSAPYHGMPEGHLPVASYLAVPVVLRSGAVIGGLFFGHSEPGVFTERHEMLVEGVAAQAAIAMDNARLFKDAQSLIAQLDQSNKELDQFAYVASHDLKAPLRGIASVSQWLEEDLSDAITPTGKEHFHLLRNRVQRMEGLINGILDYSRAGRVRTQPEHLLVGKLLHDILEMLSVPPTARVDVQPNLPELITERIPLQQVFLNLIGNALKHANRADPHVTISVRDDGDYFEFAVADNGPGIAPRFHQRIWGIFQTLEPRDTVEGTGIGLSIVKKIVENKGGRVTLVSDEGAGATFRFTWPKTHTSPSHV
jgi:GAF domain-containing protein